MYSCNICKSETTKIFDAKVLNKYNAKYFKCTGCNFIQTEPPFWLEESYSNAITSLDIGMLKRNLFLTNATQNIIYFFFNPKSAFLDFGGGYGVFVRLMRDKGFDYYRQDLYCENIFAKKFDVNDTKLSKFELLTAFEVFEHLENPTKELDKMLSLSDNILFSTELVLDENATPDSWWYFCPEIGQHISFYSKKSLELLAKKHSLNYYNSKSVHLFTKKKINKWLFKLIAYPKISVFINLFLPSKSLLDSDFEKLKKELITYPA